MAIRKIVEIGDEKLRKHCKPVEKFDIRLRLLLKDMVQGTIVKGVGGLYYTRDASGTVHAKLENAFSR